MSNPIRPLILLTPIPFHFPLPLLLQIDLIPHKYVNWRSFAVFLRLILVLSDFFEGNFHVYRVDKDDNISI